jgi:hypothetical protein
MTDGQDEKLLFGASDRVELVATIVMALAAIFTAWAAFQSAKWSGEQSIAFAQAGAARTESTRYDNRANAARVVDVNSYTSWLNALAQEAASGQVDLSQPYSPEPGLVSSFIYNRLRAEFRPAMDAWIALWNQDRDTAPGTPFELPEYTLADSVRAEELLAEADGHAADALTFNQNSDNYVLTAVAFSLVLFFGGVSSKLASPRNRNILVVLAAVLFAGAVVAVFSLPIHALP